MNGTNELAEERLAIRRQELMLSEQIDEEETDKLTFAGLPLKKFHKKAVLRVVRMLQLTISDLHEELKEKEAEPKIELVTEPTLEDWKRARARMQEIH